MTERLHIFPCTGQGSRLTEPRPKGNYYHMKKHTRKLKSAMLALVSLVLIPSCASTSNASTELSQSKMAIDPYKVKSVEQGKASWYSIKTNYGTKTASGQKLCNNAPTAAHKTLPMGTKVRVINLANNKSEVVTINDRGPFKKGRIIDVTVGTAERLGFVKRGIAPVKIEVLSSAQG